MGLIFNYKHYCAQQAQFSKILIANEDYSRVFQLIIQSKK